MAYTNECDNNKQISITNHFKSIHSFKSKTEEDERRRISKREKITNRCRRRTSERAYQVQSYRRALNIQCTQVLFFLANAWTCFRCLRSWCCSSRDRTFVFIDFWTSGWWLIYDDDGLLISWFRMSLKKRVRVCAWWYVLMITSSLVIGQTSRSMACFSAMALVWPNAGTVWTRARRTKCSKRANGFAQTPRWRWWGFSTVRMLTGMSSKRLVAWTLASSKFAFERPLASMRLKTRGQILRT